MRPSRKAHRSPRSRRARRWAGPFAVAAAAAVVVAGAGKITWSLVRPQTEALATASLDPLPAWTGAGGSAELEAAPDGYREVWLITSDTTELVSLDIRDGGEGNFPVPVGIDTDGYDLVDISAEPVDGNPAHSGDSIVRGQLQT